MLLIKVQKNKSTVKETWIDVYLTQNKNRITFYLIMPLVLIKRIKFKENIRLP